MNSGHMVLVHLLLLYTRTYSSLQSSALFKLNMSGYRLSGYVISEHNTLNLLECSLYCLRRPSDCKSINYKARKRQNSEKNCQLNNASKTTHGAQNLLPDKNYDYYAPVEKKIQKQEPVNYGIKSCDALYKSGNRTTGVYTIDPDGLGKIFVSCDMETTPGMGWTIFQRRVNGTVDFYRNWTEYKTGFGNLNGEFWLGLDKIHRLSTGGQNVLRVDLESFENERAHAVFKSFSVGNESMGFIINTGDYSGTAGNSLAYTNGMKFSTKDVDNDIVNTTVCAQRWHGAWWFGNCMNAHLNGEYLGGNHNKGKEGVLWMGFKGKDYSLKACEMKAGPDKV